MHFASFNASRGRCCGGGEFLRAGWERAKPLPTHAPHLADHGWSGAERRGGKDVLGVGLG
jgi:hypothetical protein